MFVHLKNLYFLPFLVPVDNDFELATCKYRYLYSDPYSDSIIRRSQYLDISCQTEIVTSLHSKAKNLSSSLETTDLLCIA